MAGAFDIAAADRAKSQQFPASIVKLELRENGGTSDQWVDYGDVSGMTLNVEAVFQTVSANAERQVGVNIVLEGNIVASGTNIRTALIKVKDYITDVRVTDINGHVRTFASEATGIRGDLVVGEAIGDSDTVGGAVLIPIRWKGFATMAKWLAYFATS